MSFAESIAIANPMFSAVTAPAELIPTTCPAMLSSGPPELPWLIAASVWITFEYTRAPFLQTLQLGSWTVIVRSSDETIPAVTVGPPSRASA